MSSHRAIDSRIFPAAMRWAIWDTSHQNDVVHLRRMGWCPILLKVTLLIDVHDLCVYQHRIVHTTCATPSAATKRCPRKLSPGEPPPARISYIQIYIFLQDANMRDWHVCHSSNHTRTAYVLAQVIQLSVEVVLRQYMSQYGKLVFIACL